ncbi:hypothetical protein J2Y54_002929 [Sphingomonas sp. BE123]|jgi:hypothetical protein|uniref:hypothetical protein n=1 Tax=Sphingomonas sp. BE123 TaxID=2817842 RepID=UPI002866720B|nr:hypothetical protein [Sphingomonas sp. BE123]MDR6853409.1 hypothetical protein [Sphingomonas sp. BE123]
MKLIAFAAALAVAGTAAAQDMPMPAAPAAPAATPTGDDPVGGYQPATPPMPTPPQPGATIVFQQAPAPDVAYPAPAPMAQYPICKKGQYDNCRQRGG